MKISDRKHQGRTLPATPLITIIILACLSIGAFLIVSQLYMKSLFDRVEIQQREGLIQILSIARNAIEPVLIKVRSGEVSSEEAIRQIRPLIRSMTYTDQYGKNYIVMSAYDGTTLVHPFEPSKELTNEWELKDVNGLFIVRELAKAAKAHPTGSFVRYYYYLPDVYAEQEKLTYVVGLPEIECYIATGMYLQRAIQEQMELLKKIKYASIWLLIAVLIPVSVSVFVILNRNRRLLAEVRTRKKAEEDLKKSEAKYRSIFENAVEGIFQTTANGRFISVNPALARAAGYGSPQEMMDSITNVDHYYADAGDRERYIKAINERGFVDDYVIKLKRKDGSFIWASNTSRVVKDEKGNVLYYEGTIEDITRRKQAEEEVKRLAAIVRHSSELVNLCHMDGRMVFLNEAGSKMLGIDPEDVEKTNIMQVIPDHLKGLVKNELFPTLLAGGSWDGELQYVNLKTGEMTDIHALTFTIDDPHVLYNKYLANISLDITDRKRLEEERLKLEQQLSQSQKMDAIGQLAGGVAHDFNNILMGIQGNASIMLMEYNPEHPHYQRLSRIEEHVKRGAKLTRQLLGFAREGKYELRALSVNDLLRKSAQFFIETRKEIEAYFQLQDDVYPVEADAGQMEQVFLNIFINAGHAMPKGGRLHIQTNNITLQETDARTFETRPGDYVKISISDTGTGMDEETLKRIFEPFFTTKSQQGGTGLGLASAYGIIRNHGGIINAYSEPGQGATFNVYLPSSVEKAEKKEDQGPDKDLLSGTGGILLVDDEPAILDLASEVLQMLGYTVYRAESGQEAVSIYREKQDRIDLIILDMILRGMSGSQVLKILQEINADVKVILSSGYGLQGEVRKVMEMGCLGFIQKPYNFADLSRIVYQTLNPSAQAGTT